MAATVTKPVPGVFMDGSKSGAVCSASVVIVARDQAHLLQDAVENVRAQSPVDILLVDDGSQDQTAAVAALLGVRAFHQTRRGFAAACNAGLKAARAAQVMFLRPQDRLARGALAAGLAALAEQPKAALALGAQDALPSQRDEALFSVLVRNPDSIHPAAALYRRHAALEAGGFDSRLLHYAPQELILRLVAATPAARHDSPVIETASSGRTADGCERTGEWLAALARYRAITDGEPITSVACRQSLRHWMRRHRQQLAAAIGRDLFSAETRPAAWRSAGTLLRCW